MPLLVLSAYSRLHYHAARHAAFYFFRLVIVIRSRLHVDGDLSLANGEFSDYSDAIIIIVTNVGYIGIGGKPCDDTSCILYSLPSFDNTMN